MPCMALANSSNRLNSGFTVAIGFNLKWLVTVWEPEVIWREAYCKLRERERDMPEKDQLIAFINKLRNQVMESDNCSLSSLCEDLGPSVRVKIPS
ncbi:hypothetical protein CYMTET_9484 [Cymbomonas tetramitiformis]|uniref:Uncharacterized protein n=1 Tax=Cymbomonas tetramitiformis TaxID=36881 RepID=A0AAE0GR56_9CHLO|nr:hypothetical protein CYMTET_9484 [Cymbomonas tetramitiformis]